MLTCPRCQSNRVHQSRSRTGWERLRRAFTVKRIFRCQACDWRGWGDDVEESGAAARSLTEPPPPDLAAIDEALDRAAREQQ